MTLRVIGTSPSGEVLKSTLDANNEHVIHVNVDAGGGGGGGTVDQGAAGAFAWLVTDAQVLAQLQTLNSLVPTVYDYIGGFTYDVNSNLTQVVFRLGGALGVIVSTLTMTYDISNRLTSVTRT
jgi:hypothetical protein